MKTRVSEKRLSGNIQLETEGAFFCYEGWSILWHFLIQLKKQDSRGSCIYQVCFRLLNRRNKILSAVKLANKIQKNLLHTQWAFDSPSIIAARPQLNLHIGGTANIHIHDIFHLLKIVQGSKHQAKHVLYYLHKGHD